MTVVAVDPGSTAALVLAAMIVLLVVVVATMYRGAKTAEERGAALGVLQLGAGLVILAFVVLLLLLSQVH